MNLGSLIKPFLIILSTVVLGHTAFSADANQGANIEPTSKKEFDKNIKPFLNKYCVDCHDEDIQKADYAIHDINWNITSGKDMIKWEKALEMVSINNMPPEKKTQPNSQERKIFINWVKKELKKIGRGPDDAKLAYPSQGNRVNHESLFSGQYTGPSYSPARYWLKSSYIYKQFSRQMGVRLAQPFLGISGKGFKDYSLLMADEAVIKNLMRNSFFIADHLMQGYNSPISKILFGDSGKKNKKNIRGNIRDIVDPDENKTQTIIDLTFNKIFYRKPNENDKATYIAEVFEKNRSQAGFAVAYRTMVAAMLMSKEFIFRTEMGLGKQLEDGRRMLSPQELAFAISYAFYDSPDKALLQLAKEGKLSTKKDVEREVRAILYPKRNDKDYSTKYPDRQLGSNLGNNYPMNHMWKTEYYGTNPRLLRFFREFFGYHRAVDVFKDGPGKSGHEPLRLRRDADLLVLSILEKDKNVIEELLTTNEYVMDPGAANLSKQFLAKYKKNPNDKDVKKILDKHPDIIKIVNEGNWPGMSGKHTNAYLSAEEAMKTYRKIGERAVALPKEQRAGMLTHPAWLVAFSGNFDNDPIHRGKWIREHLLAGMIPDVPIGVDAQIPEDENKTLRERMAVVEVEECWRCHKKMNPLGIPFEFYDHFGRYRTEIIVGDLAAYYKKKTLHEKRSLKFRRQLKDLKALTPEVRAKRIKEIEKVMSELKKPSPNDVIQRGNRKGEKVSEAMHKKALKKYNVTLGKYKAQMKELKQLTDAKRDQKIKEIEKQLTFKVPKGTTKVVHGTGELVGTGDPKLDGPVKDAVDLAHRLAKSDRVRQSVIRHAFRYWMGRNETLIDSPTLMVADKAYVESGGSFKEMVISLVTSDSFLYRK